MLDKKKWHVCIHISWLPSSSLAWWEEGGGWEYHRETQAPVFMLEKWVASKLFGNGDYTQSWRKPRRDWQRLRGFIGSAQSRQSRAFPGSIPGVTAPEEIWENSRKTVAIASAKAKECLCKCRVGHCREITKLSAVISGEVPTPSTSKHPTSAVSVLVFYRQPVFILIKRNAKKIGLLSWGDAPEVPGCFFFL